MKPVVLIGKNGITDSLVASLEMALNARELVKIKFIGYKEEKRKIIEVLAGRTGAHAIGITGNTAILFRQNEDPEKRVIVI